MIFDADPLKVAERIVLPQLEAVLSSIRLSDDDLKQLIVALNDKFGNQQDYLDKTIDETRAEYDNIKAQLKALTYERIEAVKKGRGLSDELFDQVAEELSEKQQSLNVKLESLTHANFGFLTTISQLLDLAQNCNNLFNTADITTKNKLLRFMLHANSSVYDKKLALEVFYPYKALQELNKKPQNEAEKTNWCNNWRKVYTLLGMR